MPVPPGYHPYDPPLLKEIRHSDVTLSMSKDHPVYESTREMIEERIDGDIGMTVLINFGNIVGLTLSYRLKKITATANGVDTLWLPTTLAGPDDFSYMVQNFGKEL